MFPQCTFPFSAAKIALSIIALQGRSLYGLLKNHPRRSGCGIFRKTLRRIMEQRRKSSQKKG